MVFFVVLDLLQSLDSEFWSTALLVLLHLRVLLYEEIKRYNSPIRIGPDVNVVAVFHQIPVNTKIPSPHIQP